MRLRWLGLILGIGLAAPPVTRADAEYDKLLKAFVGAQERWFAKLDTLQKASATGPDKSSPDAVLGVSEMPPHPSVEFLPRFQKYAEKNAGRPAAIPALAWILNSSAMTTDNPAEAVETASWALQRLTRDHAGQPQIKEALRAVRYAPGGMDPAELTAFYQRIIAVNQGKEAVGIARLNLARTLLVSEQTGENDARVSDAVKKQAHDLLEQIVKDHPTKDLVEQASGYLFEIDHLQIGMVAPEIVGTDANGKEIKLSQFRGRVVVLALWGFW
jgi:hypothetical protein